MKNKLLPLLMLLCFACFGVTRAEEGVNYQEFMQGTASFNPENMPWSWPWEGEGSLTWDNLSPDTDYTFGVRRYCNEDDQSTPVLMNIHTLPAPMTVPFSENFDASTIPNYWAQYSQLSAKCIWAKQR